MKLPKRRLALGKGQWPSSRLLGAHGEAREALRPRHAPVEVHLPCRTHGTWGARGFLEGTRFKVGVVRAANRKTIFVWGPFILAHTHMVVEDSLHTPMGY